MPKVNIQGVGSVNFPDSMSEQDIQKAIETDILPKQNYKPTNTDFAVANLGKGLTSAVGGLVDIPVNLAKAGYGMARMGIGALKGEKPYESASQAPEISFPVSDALFYGNNSPEQRKNMDEALKPSSDVGRYAARSLQFVGGSPVGGLSNLPRNAAVAAVSGLTSQGAQDLFPNSKVAPVAGALLPVAAQIGMSAMRNRPNPIQAEALQKAQDEGYVVPPATLGGPVDKALEGFAGKISTAQKASLENQTINNAKIAKGLGLPEDTPINQDTLKTIRKEAGKPYEELKATGTVTTGTEYNKALDGLVSKFQGAAKSFPNAAKNEVVDLVDSVKVPKFDASDGIDMISVLRDKADTAFRQGNPSLGKAAKGAADAIETELGRHLKRINAPTDLVESYQNARQLIAKTYSVQKALNSSTGNVSATNLAKQLDKGVPLSGELKSVAEFAKAFPDAAKDVKGSSPGISPLDYATAGVAGAVTHNPKLLALMTLRPAVRSLILSKAYQSTLTPPTYSEAFKSIVPEALAPSLEVQDRRPRLLNLATP